MSYVVLAQIVTILLAGCQVRFLQDKASSLLDYEMPALQVYADQLKQSSHKVLTHLDDTEFKDYKEFLGQSVDNLHGYFQNRFQAITTVVTYVLDAFAPICNKWTEDIEDLHKQLEPKREELREVLDKHFEEYRGELKSFLEEYLAMQHRHNEELRSTLDPLVKSVKEKIGIIWEEIKSNMLPIMEPVREKLTKELQEVKTNLEPYIQEYNDQMEQGALKFHEMARSGELMKRMNELSERLTHRYYAIVAAVEISLRRE